MKDLARAPADEIGARARQERLHLGREPHVLERAVRIALAQMPNHVLHALAAHLGGEQDSLRDVAHLLRRGGHEVEHLVIGHAQTPVHEERVVLGRLRDLGVGIEHPRPLLEVRPHEQVELRLRKRERELFREGEDAAAQGEDGAKQRERTERSRLKIFVDAEIHPRTVESGRSAVKSPTMPPWP